jgi:hypothetical protein
MCGVTQTSPNGTATVAGWPYTQEIYVLTQGHVFYFWREKPMIRFECNKFDKKLINRKYFKYAPTKYKGIGDRATLDHYTHFGITQLEQLMKLDAIIIEQVGKDKGLHFFDFFYMTDDVERQLSQALKAKYLNSLTSNDLSFIYLDHSPTGSRERFEEVHRKYGKVVEIWLNQCALTAVRLRFNIDLKGEEI